MILYIKEFIEENIDLLDKNDFTELYNRCSARGKLTDVLYECSIDPLKYMTEIPEGFAYNSNITNITIHDKITKIPSNAFEKCDLTTVNIPDSVKIIGEHAFGWCNSLTRVTISDSTSIGNYAFSHCGNLQITYSGTKQQWENLITEKNIFPYTTYVCNCSDGVVEKRR